MCVLSCYPQRPEAAPDSRQQAHPVPHAPDQTTGVFLQESQLLACSAGFPPALTRKVPAPGVFRLALILAALGCLWLCVWQTSPVSCGLGYKCVQFC